ncbi:hypothetical protein L6304_00605, partial [bacterium]|nr:hypothetical protein [bacterium]
MSKRKKLSKKKKVSKKKSPEVEMYTPTDKIEVVREQLGLDIYPEKEKTEVALEIKSKHPKTSFFNDIDLNSW